MTERSAPRGPSETFAAFRAAVHDDHTLALRLLPARDREAYVALVVSVGAERGFVFEAAAVWAALREGEDRWLRLGAEIE